MRKGQGLPINMIVFVAIILLVIIVVAVFFFTGFGQASTGVNIVNATQADCQAKCQGLSTSAFIYDNCDTLKGTTEGVDYSDKCSNYGTCTVTLRNGAECGI